MPTRQIEPEILQKLGLFVVRWSGFERLIGDLLCKLLDAERGAGFVITESAQVRTQTEWCSALMRLHDMPEALRNEWADLSALIENLRRERNALIHGLWGTDRSPPNTVMVQTMNLQGKEYITDRLITPGDLDDLIDDTQAAQRRLMTFIGSFSFRRNDP